MANKLTKQKRKYLIRVVGDAAQEMASARRAAAQASAIMRDFRGRTPYQLIW